MANRPTVSIEWGTGSIPAGPTYTLTQQQNGYAVGQQPTAQGDNGWQNGVYQWQQYFDGNLTSTATAAGTTTLTVASNNNQLFTGSTTQSVKLPDETTLQVGRRFLIVNASTGLITVKDSAGTSLFTMTGTASGKQTTPVEFVSSSSGSATGGWYIFSNQGQIPGTNTNDSALAGNVGEYLNTSLQSQATIPNGSFFNVGSLSLTPGDWKVCLSGGYGMGSTPISSWSYGFIGFGTASANEVNGYGQPGAVTTSLPTPSSGGSGISLFQTARISLAATTTVYSNGFAAYTIGGGNAINCVAQIQAWRTR